MIPDEDHTVCPVILALDLTSMALSGRLPESNTHPRMSFGWKKAAPNFFWINSDIFLLFCHSVMIPVFFYDGPDGLPSGGRSVILSDQIGRPNLFATIEAKRPIFPRGYQAPLSGIQAK